MGCSGALFGLIGYMFIDVLINWKFLPHPIRDLMSLLISTIISLVLGLLPGLDNFAHIGT
jgi:membrane associated rhomboid family serine protease